MTEMFLICDRQTRGGGRRRRSCCCSGYANTCDKTLQQIVMLNFWSQSGIHRKPSEEENPSSLTPKQKIADFLKIYLFIFQLRVYLEGKKQRIYSLHLEAEDIYLMGSI
jgi:hypothetical protein